MKPWVVVTVIVCGCGRIDFSDLSPSDGSTKDGAHGGSATLVQALGPGLVQSPMLDIPITHGSGDLLIAGVYWDQTATTVTVSNALGAAWQSLPAQIVASGCDACGATNSQIFYTTANAAGADTIRVSQATQSCPLGMFVLDYTGLSANGVVDVGTIAPVPSNTVTAPPLTVTGDAVIVAVIADGHNTGRVIPGPDFNLVTSDNVFYAGVEVSTVTAGTYTPTAMLPNGGIDRCWATSVAAFME